MPDAPRPAGPPSPRSCDRLDAYWRAANYLSVGQIYLLDNPLLREPLRLEHVKPRLLGHWGTTPGLNLIYAHLNRVIQRARPQRDLHRRPGPRRPGPRRQHVPRGDLQRGLSRHHAGRGGDAAAVPAVLVPGRHPEPRRARRRPARSTRAASSATRSSTPTARRSTTPTWSSACVIGDGEAETGPLAASWHSNKFLDPARDGAVLPDPAPQRLQDRQPDRPRAHPRRRAALAAARLRPRAATSSRATTPTAVHQRMAATLDRVLDDIAAIQRRRATATGERPRWPMIVLRTPKGWTGPKEVDGVPVEGTWRAHQVPLSELPGHPEHLAPLEAWMRSYRPEELFDEAGRAAARAAGARARGRAAHGRATRTPTAARCCATLRLPDFRDYAVDVPTRRARAPARRRACSARWLRDVMRENADARNFRVFGPDETASNRLGAVLEATDRAWMARAPAGRRPPRARTGASWRSSASTCARAGWRATC